MCPLLFLFIITFTLEIHGFPTSDAPPPADLNLMYHVIRNLITNLDRNTPEHTATTHAWGTPVLETFLSEDKILETYRNSKKLRDTGKCKETIYRAFPIPSLLGKLLKRSARVFEPYSLTLWSLKKAEGGKINWNIAEFLNFQERGRSKNLWSRVSRGTAWGRGERWFIVSLHQDVSSVRTRVVVVLLSGRSAALRTGPDK